MVTDPTSQTLMRTVQPKLGQRAPALWVQAAMTSEMVTLSPDGGGGGPAAPALLQEVHEVMFPGQRAGRFQR